MKVFINARSHDTGAVWTFTYDDVIDQVQDRDVPREGFTVTWKKPGPGRRIGEIAPGGRVMLEEGMHFLVLPPRQKGAIKPL